VHFELKIEWVERESVMSFGVELKSEVVVVWYLFT